ncbi:MAG: hypothetical protein RBS13_05200 [Bacteroidales bacterium]|jgi:hypothetical protein|nr:hypothetical protein [Bacteroidales bacterium]
MKTYLYIFITIPFLISCTVDELQIEDTSFSTVTYVKNTLDYPVWVQCYFRPFNDSNFWCENELIEYSAPIKIQPNESKVVMDYVMPSGIKIFRGSDTTLLFENLDKRRNYLVESSNGALSYSSEEEMKIGTVEGKKIIPKDWQKTAMYSVRNDYFLQNERYLCENVPWSLYPIQFEFIDCYDDLLKNNETRKSKYKRITDGYALVNCIVLNKNAICFTK